MARVAINTGASANDGTGDNLRYAGGVVNNNFLELYTYLGEGSTTVLSAPIWSSTNVGISTLRNVGIGTTNATSTLTVSGNGRFTGVVTATTFIGALTGNATTATLSTNSQGLTGTPNIIVGVVTASRLNVGTGITLNGSTGIISATAIVLGGTTLTGAGVTFITAGSGISVNQGNGNVTITATGGSGSGVIVKDSGSTVGTAGTIDFGDNLTVSAISAGIVTITGSASGGSGIGLSISDTPPANTTSYPLWYSSLIGRGFVYYNDGSSSQWVDFSPSSIGSSIGISTGIATYATSAGIATYSTSSGIATYSTSSGIATYSTSSGIATYSTSAGIATYSTSSGIATYSTSSGIATYSTSSGIATYSTSAGIATNAQGLTGTPNINVGIITATSFVGNGSGLTGIVGSGSSQFVITAAGIHTLSNVGIGTTNPTKKLTVSGDALINGITVGRGSSAVDTNTAIGYQSLYSNTTGPNNTANGSYTLYSNTTGDNNSATGNSALYFNTIGEANTAIGSNALYSNITGDYNTAIGFAAGIEITIGDKNTILGTYSGNQNGLDIRTSNNNVVLSDGDGNIRFYANSSGNVGIGTTNPTSALTVSGDARVTGILTVGTGSITLNGTTNIINVGTGLTLRSSGINVTGVITATSFSGSGTALTGIITSIAAGSNVTVSGSTGQVTINANVPAATNTTTYVNASGSSNFALSAGKLVYGAPSLTERAVLAGSYYGYYEAYVNSSYVATGGTFAANSFGDTVAISKDGSTLVIPSMTAQSFPSGFSTTFYSGLVYVYDCSSNTPTQVGILTGQLGRDYRNGPYNNNPLFGSSVGVSSDGKTIAVGAPWDEKHTDPAFVGGGSLDDAGIVYVYDKVGSTYNKIATIHPPTPSYMLKFGENVCLSQNGNSLLITPRHPYYNHVYLYDRVGNTFVGITTFEGSGASFADYIRPRGLAMTANGQTFIIGSPRDEVGSNSSSNTGVVYVFDRSGNAVSQVGILTGSGANIPYQYGSELISTSNHLFGWSVDVSDDGKTIVVGAPLDKNINTAVSGPDEGAGVVYVFDRTGSTFTEIAVLTGSLAVDSGGQSYGDKFGSSVAITADGNTIIVGAPRDEVGVTTSTGVGYLFTRSGNTFTQSNIITGSYATNTYDQFGESVAISGEGSLMAFGASSGYYGSNSYAGDELPNGIPYPGQYNIGIAATNTGLVYVFNNVSPTAIEVFSTGNVGIGTTNATSKLHVVGGTSLETLNVTGVSTFNSIAISSTTSILNTVNKLIFGNDLEIFSYSSGGTTGNFINANETPLYIGVKVEEENLNSTIGLVNIYPANDVYYGNNSYVTLGFGTGTNNNNVKLQTLGTGITVTGTTFTNNLSVSGIASVGTGITMYGSTGIISATSFVGNGSGITNIPSSQLTGSLPAINGSALTNLPGFIITFTITAPGNSDYEFSGPGIIAGNTLDPVLYLYKGFTYNFVNTTGGSHPFAIRVSNGGSSYTSGVSGSTTGTQTFIVPMNAPSTLYYQCTIHGNMGNTINII